MAFVPRWTDEAEVTYNELLSAAKISLVNRRKSKKAKAEGLFKQVEKCIRLLLENPRHPGLQTYEYHSIENPFDPNQKVLEAYAQNQTPGAYRVFWCYGRGKEITVVAITPHL
ncbi:MAG: hypothetical protein HY286_16365 [Planctomycetes bacterium]|nr:hypothetical protein [Planctomycetota bacterium]